MKYLRHKVKERKVRNKDIVKGAMRSRKKAATRAARL